MKAPAVLCVYVTRGKVYLPQRIGSLRISRELAGVAACELEVLCSSLAQVNAGFVMKVTVFHT